jgi:hypothetical protein
MIIIFSPVTNTADTSNRTREKNEEVAHKHVSVLDGILRD